jgi:endonuclease/exonuclease/phosphatase family metal-dependent hydrolase
VTGPSGHSADFSREPFFATFKKGNFDFTLVTVHVTFATAKEINSEVEKLADVWDHVQGLDPAENDILLMGDFNRDKPTQAAFGPLRSKPLAWLILGDDVFTTYSNKPKKIGANWYDNIWTDLKYTDHESTGQNGVDYTHLRYFEDAEHPHLEVRKKVSDHCPVWAVFDVSKADDDN